MINKNNNTKLLLFITMVILITFFYFQGRNNKSKIDKHGVYTIFNIYEVKNSKVSPKVLFTYKYDNEEYKGEYYCTSVSLNEMKGNRIFGKIIPYTDELYTCCYCEVPNDITEAPPKGWSSLPNKYCIKDEDGCF